MNHLLRLGLMGWGAAILCQCGMVRSIDRGDPEAWNMGVVWRAQAGSSKDHVPADFNGQPLAGAGQGEWITDPQDGYRFYIPATGTKKFPVGVLRAEAEKATNDYTRSAQKTRNTLKTAFFPVAVLLNRRNWQSSGGSGDDSDSSASSESDFSDSSTDSAEKCCDRKNGHDGHGSHGHEGGGKSDSGGHHGK